MSNDIQKKVVAAKSDLFNYIDSHIREIKYGVYCLGTVGALLCIRSLRPFKKFTKIEELPHNFVRNNVALQGTVRKIEERGKLYVDHHPVFQLPFTKNYDCLPIHLAFLSIGPQGRLWLVKNVKNKFIWFEPLKISDEGALECVVYSKGLFWTKKNLNEKMVKHGICKIKNEQQTEMTDYQSKILNNLIKLEAVADKKGIGIWASHPEQTLISQIFFKVFHSIGNIFRAASSRLIKQSKE